MLEAVEGSIHQRLYTLLGEHQMRYRVMARDTVGQCKAVSAVRGAALGQGAKALVCRVKGNGVNQHVLTILVTDQQADLASLARHIGGNEASLASPAEMNVLTACMFGATPPFSFHPALRLVADPLLSERFPQIAFNAGRLDQSVILDTEDYLHIARPEVATFCRLS